MKRNKTQLKILIDKIEDPILQKKLKDEIKALFLGIVNKEFLTLEEVYEIIPKKYTLKTLKRYIAPAKIDYFQSHTKQEITYYNKELALRLLEDK